MSNVIVIDRCWDCPHCHAVGDWPGRCEKMSKSVGKPKEEIPGWCPLRPMPERMEENNEYYDCGYADGWNDCLDEILERKEMNKGLGIIERELLEAGARLISVSYNDREDFLSVRAYDVDGRRFEFNLSYIYYERTNFNPNDIDSQKALRREIERVIDGKRKEGRCR